MSVTSYPTEPAAGRIGQLSDTGNHDVVSRYSAAVIPFGRGVSYAAAENKVKLPAAATDILNTASYAMFEGIAIEDPSKESTADNVLGLAGANAPAYEIGDAIAVLKRGRCYVYSEQAVCPSDTVFLRFSDRGTSELAGNFRKDVDTDKATSLGEKVRFVGTTTGAGPVEVDINL